MKKVNYTEAQRKAIYDTLDKSAIVTAGAGAGKTRVLVDRYVHILEENLAGVDGIVAITFTERAAAEMLERIRKAVDERIRAGGSERWLEIKERLTEAYISTIHSFCGRLIREHPVEAGVDPYFEVISPAQAEVWLDECARKAIIEALDRADEVDVRPLIMRFGFDKLIEYIIGLYRRIRDCGFTVDEASAKTDMDQLYIEAVVYLLSALDRLYADKKRMANGLDYEDMQRTALNLMRQPAIKARCRQQFKYIMVDESQDINFIQYQLIMELADPANSCRLFAVGDAKQSIYRFRGSQVELFQGLMEDVVDGGGVPVVMAENFRSTGGIIDFVNRQFKALMGDYQHASPFRKDHGYLSVEMLPVQAQGNMDSRKEAEADALAQRIKQMVEDGEAVIYDDAAGVFCAPRYGDIAVLFHKRTHLEPFEKAMERYGIPYREIGGGDFYGCQEIKDMVNALKAVAYPSDTIALVGMLKAFFAADDGALLAMVRYVGAIETALEQPETLPAGCRQLVERAAQCLQRWRQRASRANLSDLIQLILDDTGYEQQLLGQDGGAHKVGNLWKFCDMAASAAHSGMGLYEFLAHVKAVADVNQEGEVPLDLAGSDAVSIMTVHAAKGLEFPVVVIPDLSTGFKVDSAAMLFDPDQGIGIKPDGKEDGSAWQRIKDKLAEDQQQEYLRLMYVAFTRAKDRLILCSDDVDTERQKQPSWWKWVKEADAIKPLEKAARAVVVSRADAAAAKAAGADIIAAVPSSKALRYYPVTPLITYMQCPRQYYYEHVLCLDPRWFVCEGGGFAAGSAEGLSPAQIGDIVHRICERLRNKHEIDKFIDEELGEALWCRDRVKAMIEVYANSSYFVPDADEVKIEQPFMLRLDERAVLTGRIDRMIIKDGRATIVDFKTSFIDKNEVEALSAEYEPQMIAYAMAAQQVFGLMVDKAIIYYLEPNVDYQVDISPGIVDKARQAFINAINGIEKAKSIGDFPPSHRHCSRCSYKLC